MQFLYGIWSQVLCRPISIVARKTRQVLFSQHTFTFLTKRVNAVLSIRTTRVRVPLARNPSPLQYPTLYVLMIYSVRSLLRQPRSALEAGPSEAHAICFVHTPIPRLHRKGFAFSCVFSALTKGIMGNHSLGWSVIHFRGRWIRLVSCYTLLSGCRLPWPPSNCPDPPTPFSRIENEPKSLDATYP